MIIIIIIIIIVIRKMTKKQKIKKCERTTWLRGFECSNYTCCQQKSCPKIIT